MEQLALLALKSLRPVNDQIVVIGGTAHRMFLMHELAERPGHLLLTTEDVDIAAPLELARLENVDLLGEMKNAGFEESVEGTVGDVPSYKYRLREQPLEYVQFIAPQKGSGERRDGTGDRLLQFGGLHAEKLRHVDLMLHEPLRIDMPIRGEEIQVLVVNPVNYILQKLLGLKDRRGAKQGKDVLYIYDTLSIFSNSLGELERTATQLAPELSKKQTKKIRLAALEQCFIQSDATREAAAIARSQRQHPPDTAQVVAGCKLGITQVLRHIISGL